MFSTFTGNSRRPRNVNLSGSTGNPFANTSWSPAVVSNTTKTLSDAQADREKRQADRLRLKAAAQIQRTWRGHKTRSRLANQRRALFDHLYSSEAAISHQDRPRSAFGILITFCRPSKPDDLRRLLQYSQDAAKIDLPAICPENTHPSCMRRLVDILVDSLYFSSSNKTYQNLPSRLPSELQAPLRLITRIVQAMPTALTSSRDRYFAALAQISQRTDTMDWLDVITSGIATVLETDSDAYVSFSSEYLTKRNIILFEKNVQRFASFIHVGHLSAAIVHLYTLSRVTTGPPDHLLWLLAHFIHLTESRMISQPTVAHIRSIFIQLSALSSIIRARFAPKSWNSSSDDGYSSFDEHDTEAYLSKHILWLISKEGTSKFFRDFTSSSMQSNGQALQSTSLLAGYVLTLLHTFPGCADDVRMRLYLEQVTTPSGSLPTVKSFWYMAGKTSVFHSLSKDLDNSLAVLKRYLKSNSLQDSESVEDQEWRIILLFLELYTFILRLSDDEDFFSAIHPPVLARNSPSLIQACNLSFADVEQLTLFLKNTAFSLYYRASDITTGPRQVRVSTETRLSSYLSAEPKEPKVVEPPAAIQLKSTKLELESLREIISSAMTMLYERDSRKPFLAKGHWLLTDKLQTDDFVSAVIAEEQRQLEEEITGIDDEMENIIDEYLSPGRETTLTLAGRRLTRHARMERLRLWQARKQRERRLAEMGPKLEILKHMPFVVPFDTRVMIFRQFIELDMARRSGSSHHMHYAKHTAQIRRGQLFKDAFKELYGIGDGLKDVIQITFVDQFDNPEAGIDGGGVTKEFLISVTSEAFGNQDDSLSMFTSSPDGLLYPNPTAIDTIKETMRQGELDEKSAEWRQIIDGQLKRYEFLGRIVGKCMYEGILVDLNFAGFFLLRWPSYGPSGENKYKGSINDLRDMDEELYNGMLRLKNYAGDVSELGIDFTVNDQVSMPDAPIKTVTKLLVANGDEIYVTNDNRPLYISYMARHRLVVQSAAQTAAFLRGLRSIIRPSWLSMFNQSELQRLVGGDSSAIDIDDLRKHTVYGGLYEIGDDNEEHPTIRMFWNVLKGFTDRQRRDLLKYVSSTPRAPLLGFSQLRPRFSIRDAGTDEERLPSTSTCVNLLKLPRYTDETTLREKLLYAITSGAGFDLS